MSKIDRLTNLTENEEILWQDRKRYLGLPLSFTIYSFVWTRTKTKSIKGLCATVTLRKILPGWIRTSDHMNPNHAFYHLNYWQ